MVRQFPRFVAAGAANTIVTYLLYLALLRVMPYLWSYLVTYLIGIALGYMINSVWVFRRAPELGTAAAYPFVYLLNLLLGAGLLAALVEWVRVPKEWAPLIVLAISVPIMFVLTRALFQKGEAR